MAQYRQGTAKVIAQAPPTTAPTLAEGGAGSGTAGAHSVKVTFVHLAGGETMPGPASDPVTIAAAKKIDVSAIPLGPPGTSARKLYMTEAGFEADGPWKYAATIADNTSTTGEINVADGDLGAVAPTASSFPTARVSLLGGVAPGNIAPGDEFQFEAEPAQRYVVSTLVAGSQTDVVLTEAYTGDRALEEYHTYHVTRDFTARHGFAELFSGDRDFRDIFTQVVRQIGGLISALRDQPAGAELLLEASDAANATAVLRAIASQTGDLAQVRSSADVALWTILAAGHIAGSGLEIRGVKRPYRRADITGVVPSSVADTYGAETEMLPAAGYYGLALLGVVGTAGGTFGSETLTVRVRAHHSDATTTEMTLTFTAAGQSAISTPQLVQLPKDGQAVVKLGVACKSTINNSTATGGAILTALNT